MKGLVKNVKGLGVCILLAIAITQLLPNKKQLEANQSKLPTRGRYVEDQINEFLAIAYCYDYDCSNYQVPESFYKVAKEIDRDFTFGNAYTHPWSVTDSLWGRATIDSIFVFVAPCSPVAVDVFFHECGHVVLGHTEEYYTEDQAEGEANYFALQVMLALGQRPIDPRTIWAAH